MPLLPPCNVFGAITRGLLRWGGGLHSSGLWAAGNSCTTVVALAPAGDASSVTADGVGGWLGVADTEPSGVNEVASLLSAVALRRRGFTMPAINGTTTEFDRGFTDTLLSMGDTLLRLPADVKDDELPAPPALEDACDHANGLLLSLAPFEKSNFNMSAIFHALGCAGSDASGNRAVGNPSVIIDRRDAVIADARRAGLLSALPLSSLNRNRLTGDLDAVTALLSLPLRRRSVFPISFDSICSWTME